MKRPTWIFPLLAALALSACGEGGRTADVVQAATKGAAEAGQQLAEKAAALASLAPEQARAKLQELVDTAAHELREVRDSETAQRVVAEVEQAFAKLAELGVKLGQKLDLAGLQVTVEELITRFKDDPRVSGALKSLQEKLNALAR